MNKDSNEFEFDYLEEKRELVISSPIEELIQILDEITHSELRSLMNKNILSIFVADKYKKIKNNSEKYGLETKMNFCKTIQGKMNIKPNNGKLELQKITLQHFWTYILYAWCTSNVELDKMGTFDYIDEKKLLIDYKKLFEKALKANVSRETLTKLYKFSPTIPLNKKTEEKIEKAPTRWEVYNKEYEKDDSEEKIQEYKKKIEDLKKQLKENKENYTKIKTELEYKIIESMESTLEVEELNKKIIVQEKKYSKLQNEYEKNNKDLKEKNKEINEKYNNLFEEYQKLSNKKSFSGDVEKMKQSLEDKISILEEKNNKLLENNQSLQEQLNETKTKSNTEEDLIKKIKNLEDSNDRLIKMRISELDQKIKSDKKYQQTILSLILNNSKASKLVVKHLNLKEEVIQEGYDYYDNLMLDKQIELNGWVEKIAQARNDFENITNKIRDMKDKNIDQKDNVIKYAPKDKFKYDEYIKNLNNNILKNNYQFTSKTLEHNIFFIADNDKILDILDLKKYDIPFVRKSVESNWEGFKDWFGYFENEKFIPSKTGISDFYKFIESTEEVPFGVIIFDNFNIIPPELYLSSFIQDLTNIGEFKLINSNKDINLKSIKCLQKLKYIFIKSKDSDTSFKISEDLQKYELKGVE